MLTTRRFVTVPNGFGGTTTRKITDPPTTDQTDYLRRLLAEHAGNEVAEAVRSDLNRRRLTGTLTTTAAKQAIRKLLALRSI